MKIFSAPSNSIAEYTIILHFSTDMFCLVHHNHASPFSNELTFVIFESIKNNKCAVK